jgi:hypothetical protein
MTNRVYVVDTSYLLELFRVDNFSTEKALAEVTARFKDAFQRAYPIYVPLPCLFELGNHIADVPDGGRRSALAKKLCDTIKTGFEEGTPWTILPSVSLNQIQPLLDAFSSEWAKRKIGVTDAFTIEEARKLKNKYSATLGYAVHIWTKDHALKAQEPDAEPNPFVN